MTLIARLSFAIAVVHLGASPMASAQSDTHDNASAEPTTSTLQPIDLEAVTVQRSRYDPRKEDTTSRVVIGQDELLQYGDMTLSDALKRLPGVTVGAGAPGQSGGIALRGLGGGYTQLLVNGRKAPPGFDIGTLTPDMIERVEIIRSATADMRTEGIAGTINIVLPTAARKDRRHLKLGIGNSNGKWLPTLNWHQSRQVGDRNHALNVTASRREFLVEESGIESGWDSDGAANLRRTTMMRTEGSRDVLSVAPSFSLKLDNGGNLAVQGYLDASNYNKYADIDWHTLQGSDLKHVRYDQFTGIDVVQLRGDINWSHDLESGGSFNSQLGLSGNRETSKFREQGYSLDGAQNLEDQTDGRLRVRGANSTGKYSFPPRTDHHLELGWDASVDDRRETRMQRLLPIGAESEYFSDLDFDAQVQRYAFYVQDDWSVASHWSMYLGARWERIETSSDGSAFDQIRNRATIVSPVLQSRWKLPGSNNHQIRLGLSRVYRSPTLRLLIPRPYTSTNNRPLNPDQQGNPDLRPELATALDLAYEKYWNDGAQLSMGVYLREIDDVVRTETRLVNDRWVSSPLNAGNATAWGLEMDTKFSLDQLISGAPAANLRFNATRNWSKVAGVPGPDNRLDQQPKLSASVGTDYEFSPAWTVGASYTFRSGGPIRTSVSRIDRESARREFDAYSLWALSGKSTLRLSVGNVLEQDIVTGTEYFFDEGTQRIERRRRAPVTIRAQVELEL